jgi:hypothetical protein
MNKNLCPAIFSLLFGVALLLVQGASPLVAADEPNPCVNTGGSGDFCATTGGWTGGKVTPNAIKVCLGEEVAAAEIEGSPSNGTMYTVTTNTCPGPAYGVNYVTNPVVYVLRRSYFTNTTDQSQLESAPTTFTNTGIFSYDVHVVITPDADDYKDMCGQEIDLLVGTYTVEVVGGAQTNVYCGKPPQMTNSGSITPSGVTVCPNATVVPPTVTPPNYTAEIHTNIFYCPGSSNQVFTNVVTYSASAVHWDQTIPTTFAQAGTYTYTAKVDMIASPTAYCGSVNEVTVGTFTVTVAADDLTNTVCLNPGSLGSAGTITPASSSVCAGGSIVKPVVAGVSFSPGSKQTTILKCPEGTAETAGPQEVAYTPGTPYFVPDIPSSIQTPGTYAYAVMVKGLASDTVCSDITVSLGTYSLTVTNGGLTNRWCMTGSAKTPGSLSASTDTICVNQVPAWPTVTDPQFSNGTNFTAIRNCSDADWHTNVVPFAHSISHYWMPALEGPLTSVGTHTFSCYYVAGVPASTGCTPVTNKLGDFVVTVVPPPSTNISCAAAGSLTNAGGLTFDSTVTFAGYGAAFPSLTNAGFGDGLVQKVWTTCSDTLSHTDLVTVAYGLSTHWSPAIPAKFTNAGSYTFTNMLVGTPSDGPCQAVTNAGPMFTVTVIQVDIDTDSDNTGAIDRMDGEEEMEDIGGDPSKPGKIILVNGADRDKDGIPDFADGFDVQGQYTNTHLLRLRR